MTRNNLKHWNPQFKRRGALCLKTIIAIIFPILIIVLLSSNSFSQEITGKIQDRSNGLGLPYASIYYKNKNIGAYSDSTGNYQIAKIQGDTLIFSMLGFEKAMVSSDDLKDFSKIMLIPIPIDLSGVEITGRRQINLSKNGRKLHLGNLSSERHLYVSGMKGRTVAYLVNTDASMSGQVRSVTCGIQAKADAILRIHLFDVDRATGKPGTELLQTPQLAKVKSGSKNVSFDLTGLNVSLPINGVFIGLEWMGEIDNNNSLNISPTYTSSRSEKATTVYTRYMGKDWSAIPRFNVPPSYRKTPKSVFDKHYFENPNFKLIVSQ